MPRGGKREGAGRKKGTPNKATAAREKAIAESGMTPLEFLLNVMRDEERELADRVDAAKAAAPYVHPRLASTELKAADGQAIVFKMVLRGHDDVPVENNQRREAA